MEWRKQNKYHSESWLISDVAQRRLLVTFHNISQQTTNLHSIKSHNSQDLIYTMAEAWNHTNPNPQNIPHGLREFGQLQLQNISHLSLL